MFRAQRVVLLALAVTLSACTSIRVTGFVTDAVTGEPVSGCGISFGPSYANTDAAGHFTINGRKGWPAMELIASGYETKSVSVDASDTRYPVVRVQLTPKSHGGGARP